MFQTELTFWHSKGADNGFNQTQHIESAGTHIGQEEHDANTATKFWPQRSAYHIWVKLRQSKVHLFVGYSVYMSICVFQQQKMMKRTCPDWQTALSWFIHQIPVDKIHRPLPKVTNSVLQRS